MTYEMIKQDVSRYYSEKIDTHGATHQGVDWNSRESQELRFQQLLRGFDLTAPFTINDYGCGYGALVDYLQSCQFRFEYTGYDISAGMIAEAQKHYSSQTGVCFVQDDKMTPNDYTVASGIFNVRLERTEAEWKAYILKCLEMMNGVSGKGFSFNILTLYSDAPYRKDYLYYADPCFLFDYCKKHFSRNVSLFHDYNLYEFTISVRKEAT